MRQCTMVQFLGQGNRCCPQHQQDLSDGSCLSEIRRMSTAHSESDRGSQNSAPSPHVPVGNDEAPISDDTESLPGSVVDAEVEVEEDPMDFASMCVKPEMRSSVCQALPIPNTNCVYMCVTKCVC